MEHLVEIYNVIIQNSIFTSLVLLFILLATLFVSKMVFLRFGFAKKLLPLITKLTDEELIDSIARKISSIVAIAFTLYINQITKHAADVINIIFQTICWVLIIVNTASLLNNGLDVFILKHTQKNRNKNNSIKGYIEIAKIIVWVISFILVIALMTEQSPIIIISSFGAIAAVLMFVFQHTLLSFVANILVSNGKVLKNHDWIELPSSNISGEVIDIALHTITVRNWDNTISRIPTKDFLTEKYTNWQPMFTSGGRRIKRSFYIDQSSIEFVTPELINELRNNTIINEMIGDLLNEYFTHLTNSHEWGIKAGVTNLQVFRKYIYNWINMRGDVRKDTYLVIRTMSPTPEGLPIELYCFTYSTDWVTHEKIQTEIFEYINASVKYFNLKTYQSPSGNDITNLIKNRK